MKFKLIIAFVRDDKSSRILKVAREAGATGATIISQASGEGLIPNRTFLGLDITAQCDVLMFVVEEHLSGAILDKIAATGQFDDEKGAGIALQIAVEDVVGLSSQIRTLATKIAPSD